MNHYFFNCIVYKNMKLQLSPPDPNRLTRLTRLTRQTRIEQFFVRTQQNTKIKPPALSLTQPSKRQSSICEYLVQQKNKIN